MLKISRISFIRVITSLMLAGVLLLGPVLAGADIDGMLQNVVGGIQVTGPGIYKSSSMTTLSGGNGSFRLNQNLLGQPAITFQAPSLNASCAGLNWDAGALGLMNIGQFAGMLEQAGSAMAWGVMVGLVYSLPGVGEAFQKLNEWARFIQQAGHAACGIGEQAGLNIGHDIFGTSISSAGAAAVTPEAAAVQMVAT